MLGAGWDRGARTSPGRSRDPPPSPPLVSAVLSVTRGSDVCLLQYEMYTIERNAERTATAGRLLYDM